MKRCAERAEHVCKFYPRLCHKCLAFREETNADKIRSMTDEELAEFLWGFDREETARESEHFLTKRKIVEWLKQPVEVE
jgi:hypothetical protein